MCIFFSVHDITIVIQAMLAQIHEETAARRDACASEPKGDKATSSGPGAIEPPEKYVKMAKLGVPPLAVLQKMMSDKCSQEEIAAVEVRAARLMRSA